MNKQTNRKGILKDNHGSALVTVVVVTVFISILATTLLYVALRNFQIKQTDYQNKQNFYAAEAALEELRTIMTIDASDACAYAYKAAMSEYAVVNADTRRHLYNEAFVKYLTDLWNTRVSAAGGDWLAAVKVQTGLQTNSADCITALNMVTPTASDLDKGYFMLQGVQAEVSDGNGFTTVITTDIYMVAPELDWTIENFVSLPGGVTPEKKQIEMSDYVVFTNWKKD